MNEGNFSSEIITIDNLIAVENQHINRIKDMCLFSKNQLNYCQEFEARSSENVIRPSIKEVISKWRYPLYLIDILLYEKSTADINGIGECDVVAISCRSIDVYGDTTKIDTWICDENVVGSEQVITSLKNSIDTIGTPLIWTSTMTDYLSTITTGACNKDPSLLAWAEEMMDKVIDLNALLLNFYVAPGLAMSPNCSRNLDSLDRTYKKKYTLNELYDLIGRHEDLQTEALSLEMKQATEAVFKHCHTRFSMHQINEEESNITPFLEQYLFGSQNNRSVLAGKICEYSQIKTEKMAEWYRYWIMNK